MEVNYRQKELFEKTKRLSNRLNGLAAIIQNEGAIVPRMHFDKWGDESIEVSDEIESHLEEIYRFVYDNMLED